MKILVGIVTSLQVQSAHIANDVT